MTQPDRFQFVPERSEDLQATARFVTDLGSRLLFEEGRLWTKTD